MIWLEKQTTNKQNKQTNSVMEWSKNLCPTTMALVRFDWALPLFSVEHGIQYLHYGTEICRQKGQHKSLFLQNLDFFLLIGFCESAIILFLPVQDYFQSAQDWVRMASNYVVGWSKNFFVRQGWDLSASSISHRPSIRIFSTYTPWKRDVCHGQHKYVSSEFYFSY